MTSTTVSFANRYVILGYSWSPIVEPSKGGWMMCLKRMNKILEINKDAKTIKTQPGISVAALTKAAQNQGLEIQSPTVFNFPTVGGIMATAAHGTGNTTKTFSDYVLSFSIVDGLGNLWQNVTNEDDLRAAGCNLGCLGKNTNIYIYIYPSISEIHCLMLLNQAWLWTSFYSARISRA